jgi:TonB family protein
LGIGMTQTMDKPPQVEQQGDRLLWLAAGIVAAIGITWLVISKPWSAGPEPAAAPAAAEVANATAPPMPARARPAAGPSGLSNPLRMAQLAYEAGMLVEPEDYSAWTLFAGVLAEDPDNATAKAGLEAVSGELLRRASVALEQGRLDAASQSVERILAALPEHEKALSLGAEIESSRPKPAPAPAVVRAAPPPAPAPRREAETRRADVAAPDIEAPRIAEPVNPILAPHEAFQAAMRENRLLTPAENNAKHYVETMRALDPDNELTLAAQSLLSSELLGRSSQALEALDPEAAEFWIDAADSIASDRTAIAVARARLNERLVALESAKPIPASSFDIETYVAPEFPQRALQRSLEGWVDLEFTVLADGSVSEITVSDGSHERFFRSEAAAAVAQWRFAPRVFMGSAIPQRSYTRIRFTIQD